MTYPLLSCSDLIGASRGFMDPRVKPEDDRRRSPRMTEGVFVIP